MALMSAHPNLPSVNERLYHATQIRRIRISEFFKDFDPLRSGYITCEQLRRCLDQHIGVKLSEGDYKALCEGYHDGQPGRFNYRKFSNFLENIFDPAILDGQPRKQFQSTLTRESVPASLLQQTDAILGKCRDYYMYHGINVKSCYRDFDKHHQGLVTQSQFLRSFPGPADISTAERELLATRYHDQPSGLYNYLQFHYDVEELQPEREPPASHSLPHNWEAETREQSLEAIFSKLRDAVFKNGIRTTEFFRDHDKLRSGLVTENQFVCGLSLCCGSAVSLSREEVAGLVAHYRGPDGRVRYQAFCHLMENTYNLPELEKRPTAQPFRPLRGHLIRPLNDLGPDEERVRQLLQRLKVEVKKRRLMLYPYFRDFDRGKGYTRGVTKQQFKRIIDFFSLPVTQEDLKLLLRKFEAGNETDVNYVAFVECIDSEYTGQVKEQPAAQTTGHQPSLNQTSSDDVDVSQLVSRIREHVVINRIRVSEHFEDFDPLRSGSIAESRFRQGLSSLGFPYLKDEQFSALVSLYRDPQHSDKIAWKRFLAEVDPVLTGGAPLLREGALDFKYVATSEQKTLFADVMHRMREKASQRRVLAKPCFQDFDKHNMGYVTESQFRQCLSYLGLRASQAEASVIAMHFSDCKGFHYVKFLEELLPSEQLEDKYQSRMSTLLSSQSAGSSPKSADLQDTLDRIKTIVGKKRVRVLEFLKDYDKHKTGRILKTSFRRALDLCGFELSQNEILVLEQEYQSKVDPLRVDYTRFSDEIESIFTTKGLEKNPTALVEQFKVPVEVDLNVLSPKEEQVLQETLHRLAERVRVRRVQLMPLFEDYDRVHIGSVTRSQFHRVLSELELGGLVNDLEFHVLYRKFDVKVGGFSDVNYIAFCDMCEKYAQTKWSEPQQN